MLSVAERAKSILAGIRPLTFESIVHAASRYDVPLAPLLGILPTENGRLGRLLAIKRNMGFGAVSGQYLPSQ